MRLSFRRPRPASTPPSDFIEPTGPFSDPEHPEDPGYHTILVAFAVAGRSRDDAQHRLMALLPPGGEEPIDCWWIAEDDRLDGSDNDSAIFVRPGAQLAAAQALAIHGVR